MRDFAIAAFLLILAPASGRAQRLTPQFATLPNPFADPASASATAAFGHPDDYRWEGLVLGGAGLGVFGSVVAFAFCGDPDAGSGASCGLQPLVGFLAGATVGGVTGGLLGGLIPKSRAGP